jgi:hypothetical protein
VQSISASIEGSLPENTAIWQARFNHDGRTIWIADAHRGDGKPFVARQATGAWLHQRIVSEFFY